MGEILTFPNNTEGTESMNLTPLIDTATRCG